MMLLLLHLKRLVRDQGVGGSNPLSPTNLFIFRSGYIGYTLGPKGFSRGCKVFSSRWPGGCSVSRDLEFAVAE